MSEQDLSPRHFRRYGALYIIFALFAGSWIGQLIAQSAKFTKEQLDHGQQFMWSDFWPTFWSATLENWQSEWLSNFTTGVLLTLLASKVFQKGDEEMLEVNRKLDVLLEERQR